MGQRRTDHGGILSPDDALYHATHDYEHGGLPVLATRLGTSADVLRKKVDPNYHSHQPQYRDFLQVLTFSRDARLLDAICQPLGVIWNFESECKHHPGELDLLALNRQLMERAIAVISELEKALRDGVIDAKERARIDLRLMELAREMKNVVHTAEQFREQ